VRVTCRDRFFLTRSTIMTLVIFLIWSLAVVLGTGIGTATALSSNAKAKDNVVAKAKDKDKDKDKCKNKGGKKDCPPSPHKP
jgi:hypothetical protein